MFLRGILQILRWIWEQIDTILALLLGAICSILGLTGLAQPFILASATLGILTILAFVLIRDRSQREYLRRSLNQFVATIDEPGLDAAFIKAADDIPILIDAQQEAWFVQETGTYALETKKVLIKTLLQKGGVVRFVVLNPREEVLRQQALRNSDFSLDTIKGRTTLFKNYLQGLVAQLGSDAERLQVRFIPFAIDAASIFVDPSSPIEKNRKANITYFGFRVPFEERLSVTLYGNTSPKLFSHYFQQVRYLYEHASKIVLIAGAPRSNKTAVMKRLYEEVGAESRSNLFSILFQAIWKGNKHIGYEVVTSANPLARLFATRRNNEDYEVNTEIWASIVFELGQARSAGKIILLDEIGPLQLLNADFLNIIMKIIEDPSATMFASVALNETENDFLRKIMLHPRSTVLRLLPNKRRRDEVEKMLEQEMGASLQSLHFEFF